LTDQDKMGEEAKRQNGFALEKTGLNPETCQSPGGKLKGRVVPRIRVLCTGDEHRRRNGT